MTRLLIIPAAGRGSRLGWNGPKALCPVAGRPMLDHLLARYAPVTDRVVIVVAPSAEPEFRRHIGARSSTISVVVQPEPTGMLPAILCAQPLVFAHQPEQVWITWCDQIGISERTVSSLAREFDEHPEAALVFPTVGQTPPYIHFIRDDDGRIVRVLHRREGDPMPAVGESDAGLFGLRRDAYLTDLPAYDAVAPAGGGTHERNFLPFIPWLAARRPVRTIALEDPREAIGVNTAGDRALLEAYLHERA